MADAEAPSAVHSKQHSEQQHEAQLHSEQLHSEQASLEEDEAQQQQVEEEQAGEISESEKDTVCFKIKGAWCIMYQVTTSFPFLGGLHMQGGDGRRRQALRA